MSYIPSPVFEMLGIGFRVLCCGKSSMFVIPANEGSIETWNRGTHTHTHTHTMKQGLREARYRVRCILIRIVQGNRQSVYEPLNFYPIMGLAATYVKRETEIWICLALPLSRPRKFSPIDWQIVWRKFMRTHNFIMPIFYYEISTLVFARRG